MTPSFSDFFKSFYYSNNYVPSVDLGEQGLSRHLLENEDKDAAAIVQQLISIPEVQSVLSEPLTYDTTEINKKNTILKNHDFKLLSSKPNLLTKKRIRICSRGYPPRGSRKLLTRFVNRELPREFVS